MDTLDVATACAPGVDARIMAAIVSVESGGNPYSIGVVDGVLQRQPRSKDEAIATAKSLEQGGWNFSLGKSQINRHNLAKYGLNYTTAFNPCANMRAAALIFKECYGRASGKFASHDQALQASLSCYYSGNFRRGFIPDSKGKPSYVAKVMSAAAALSRRAASGELALAIPVLRTSGTPKRSPINAGLVPGQLKEHSGPVVLLSSQKRKAFGKAAASPFDGYAADDDQSDQNDGYAEGNSASTSRLAEVNGNKTSNIE